MQNPAASKGQSVRFVTDPSIPTSISALLSERHAVTRLPGAGRIGVSAAGTSSVKMNNAPEMIVSDVNNNGLGAPAAFTSCIPSPKAWTSYTFRQRNTKNTQTPVGASTIAKTVKGHTSPLIVVPPLEGLLLPATIVIMEEDLIQIRTDLTHQTPGMNPPGVTEMEEVVEQAVEEGVEEAEITEIKSPRILMPLLGGGPQKSGRSTTN